MIRRSFRIGLALGLLGGLAFALVKLFGSRGQQSDVSSPTSTDPWPRLTPDPALLESRSAAPTTAARPQAAVPAKAASAAKAPTTKAPTTKAPAKKVPAAKAPTKKAPAARKAPAKAATRWVAPTGDVCPTSHPVKAKLTSKIFHLPGMLNYERTKPDRCYVDGSAAEADGLRAAKR